MNADEIKARWIWLSEHMRQHNFKHIGGHGELYHCERTYATIMHWKVDGLTVDKMHVANLIYRSMRKQGLIPYAYKQ